MIAMTERPHITCWKLVLCSVLLGILALPANGLAQTLLRWKFSPGQELKQTMTQEMGVSMSVKEQEIETSVSQTIDGLWKIDAVDDSGVASMTQIIRRIRMAVNGPVKFEVDTGAAEAPPGIAGSIAAVLKTLVDAEFRLKMNPRGEVLELTVPEEATDALQNLPGGQQVSSMFNADAIKKMIAQGTPSFPEDKVAQGESWKREFSAKISPAVSMDTVSTYTYAGASEDNQDLDKLRVDMKQIIQSDEDEKTQISIVDQKTDGTIYFDNQAGYMVRSNIKQALTTRVAAGGQTFDQQIEQTIKVSFTPVE